jgi:hypothetical protein
MGKAEKRMIREAYRRKKPVPERIQNAPDLLLGLELYFDAFIELSTCRNTGWAPGPIPFWSIYEYCAKEDLDAEESEDMFFHIRHMDQAYLQFVESKNQEKT